MSGRTGYKLDMGKNVRRNEGNYEYCGDYRCFQRNGTGICHAAGSGTAFRGRVLADRKTRKPVKGNRFRHAAYRKILPLDLTNEADMTVLTESLAEEKPVVRMLINCAGYGMMGDLRRFRSKNRPAK